MNSEMLFMPKKADKELQQAIEALVIEDVYLHSNQSHCSDSFDPKYGNGLIELQVQHMHSLKEVQLLTLEDQRKILRIQIGVGTRWVKPIEESTPEVMAVIEADFIAEYVLKHDISDECVQAFSEKNSSYHIWPYWREFLSSQCERMRIPRIVIPSIQVPSSNK